MSFSHPDDSSKTVLPLVKAVITSRAPRLSEQIGELIETLTRRPMRLREILDVMQARAYTLLLILLALPFCLPIPLIGLSTPFGVVIVLIGFRLSLRQAPWLPQRVLNYNVSSPFILRILEGSRRFVRGIEFFLRPRWSLLLDFGPLHHLYGAVILICGALLLLPLPVPFSNFLPAFTIVLLAAAMLEKDGYFVVAGMFMFLLSLIFFGGIFFGGATAVLWLKENFEGVLQPDYEVMPTP